MATHPRIADPSLLGALLGWRRYHLPRGSILRVEVAQCVEAAKAGEFDSFDIALNTTQLRALGEDLIRAADEADGRPTEAERKRAWWKL